MGDVIPFDREAMLEELRHGGPFDVLVIGGGITGCGVALDAASRGLRTALVERDDFAAGTSSKSSKLVHGGLRYLQQGDVRLVYEALRERYRLRRNAPHLVSILPFMIPVLTKDSVVSHKIARALGIAMWMYDLTGGFRIGRMHKRLNADEAFEHMPTTRRDRLRSAYLYYDATADDARLTLEIALTAAAHGAVVANECDVVGFGNAPNTVRIHDRLGDATIEVDARVVVNAAGVWTDDVRALHEGTHPGTVRPAKGIHITVPWDRVRNDIAVVIPVPGDKRTLFVVPWGRLPGGAFRYCYVGTTDTDYDGPLDNPQCTAADITYVLRALNAALDPALTEPVTAGDITATWAGLRPLVAGAGNARTADLSRRHVVKVGDDGVVRVTGGKLTTYREMAEDTVDVVMERLGRKGRSITKKVKLVGATSMPADGVDDEGEGHLLGRYGARAREVRDLAASDPTLGEVLVPGLPYVRAEAVHAVQHEMATSLVDVLTRRTRAHLLDRDAARSAAPEIARLLAPVAGWSPGEVERQVEAYIAICDEEDASSRGAMVLER